MKYILIFIAFVAMSGIVTYQGVRTDATMTGTGITGDELKVDTSWVATRYYVDAGSVGGTPSATTISPSQLTADQDNYNPTAMGKATYVRLDGDNGMRAITGIADSVAGTLEKTLYNKGSYILYLPQDHPDSDAAHRFTGWPGDYILYPGCSVKIWYDLTSTKWRIIGEVSNDRKKGIFFNIMAGSVTAGDWPNLGMIAVGTGTIAAAAATTSLPSASTLSTSTSTTAGYNVYFPKSTSKYTAFGSAHNYVEALITIPTASDGTQTFTVELQLTADPSSTTLENNNTSGVRYSHGINSGKWELFNQSNAGAESVADLGVTVSAATMYKIRIEMDKSRTEARAYINDAYCGRVTGSFPNAIESGCKLIIVKSAGTTARTLLMHNLSAGAIYP